jgi:hypothetical protein
MGKGYAEGSAVEERLAALERGDLREEEPVEERKAVFGSTAEEPAKHFLGWLGEVDPDVLFDSGEAWGITVIRRRVS